MEDDDVPPVAVDDTGVASEGESAGDTDGNVRTNDTNPSGPPLPVAVVAGNAANVGVAVAGSSGGKFTINVDGTYDFDANGDFDSLADGESATTSVTYGITFTGAASVVDVVLLQDLSGSFGDDLPNVRAQFSSLFDTLNAGRDVQFGVASHIDKPVSPFGGSGDFVYQTDLAVSGDKPTIQATLNGLFARGGSDTPESQFEALLQLAKRADGEVGYRDGAQRIVVLATDAIPHLAGDYASAGPNDGDAVIENEDYPTVAQVRAALEAADIFPIFSVTSNVVDAYQDLVVQLGRGTVVQISSNSSNLSAAIIDTLDTITTVDTATLTITVTGEGGGGGLPDCPVVTRAGTVVLTPVADQNAAGPDGPNTFYVSVDATSGDDTITNFGSSDVLVTDRLLSDRNGDGIVKLGTNMVLDVDRDNNGGNDTIAFGESVTMAGLRYLGESCEGVYVYADASVRPDGAIEGTLGDDSLAGTAAQDVFFFDNALEIDLGNDTISNFGANDLLVTTAAISDANGNGIISFGGDKALDFASGGEVAINGKVVRSLEFDGSVEISGVEYFVYSRVGSAAGVDDFVGTPT